MDIKRKTFTSYQLNKMNSSRLWKYTIITPNPSVKHDTTEYVCVPTGECTLDGRIYRSVLIKDYVKMTKEDKVRENIWD